MVGCASSGALSPDRWRPANRAIFRRGRWRKAFKYSRRRTPPDEPDRPPGLVIALPSTNSRTLRVNPRVRPMRLLPGSSMPPMQTAPERHRLAAAPRRPRAGGARSGPRLGADPLARPAPPRAHRRPPAGARRALALPALRLRRQRRADPPLCRHARLRARRGVRHLQPPPRADRDGAPGAPPTPMPRAAARRASEFGVSVLPEGAAPRLRPRACSSTPMLHARNRGVETIFIHALSENTAMLKLARKRRRDGRARRLRVRGLAEAAARLVRLAPGRASRRARRRARLPAEGAVAAPGRAWPSAGRLAAPTRDGAARSS